jgi:hypothetical protein
VINTLGKVAGDKINIQKSIDFLYTSTWTCRKTTPFTITSKKRKKYLGINLTKEVRDRYNENYKTLMKWTEEDIRRWK